MLGGCAASASAARPYGATSAARESGRLSRARAARTTPAGPIPAIRTPAATAIPSHARPGPHARSGTRVRELEAVPTRGHHRGDAGRPERLRSRGTDPHRARDPVGVRLPHPPGGADRRAVLAAHDHARVDGVEVGDRGRRERRERRVEVRDPVDHVPALVEAVEAAVLAHQPVPVVAALGVRVGDAHDRPGQRDLLRPGRVGAQRAPARLHDRGGGRHRGEVDQAGDPAGVPALPQQPAGADQDPGAAGLEEAGDHAHPVPARPRPDQGGDLVGRAARPAGRRGPGRRRRGARRACRGDPATVRPVTSSGSRPAVAGSASRAARTAWAEPDSWSSTPRRSTGRVALARSWSQSTSIRSRSPRLRCSADTMATVAVVFASDRASTRSTGERPRRMPRLVAT